MSEWSRILFTSVRNAVSVAALFYIAIEIHYWLKGDPTHNYLLYPRVITATVATAVVIFAASATTQLLNRWAKSKGVPTGDTD